MKLFVYDHCPYCVKARMIFGFKNVDCDLVTLLNDDEKTPTSMIGQKMVPILEKEDGQFMGESLDIIEYIDNLDKKPMILDASNKNISSWLSRNSTLCYELAMPRWVKVSLKEFETQSSIDYFTKKKESYIGPFKQHLDNTSSLIEEMEEELNALAGNVFKKKIRFVNEKLSLDDFHLFALLRSLSVVKGLSFPNNVEAYMKSISKESKVPLHTDIAV